MSTPRDQPADALSPRLTICETCADEDNRFDRACRLRSLRAWKLALAIVASVAAACGSTSSPEPDASTSLTWGDAETAWARAWCAYAERCYPDQFATLFATQEACTLKVSAANCAQRGPYMLPLCDAAYPESGRVYLEQCVADMAEISCAATSAPMSCFAAFGAS